MTTTCPDCTMEYDETKGECPVCKEMAKHGPPPAPEGVDPAVQQNLRARLASMEQVAQPAEGAPRLVDVRPEPAGGGGAEGAAPPPGQGGAPPPGAGGEPPPRPTATPRPGEEGDVSDEEIEALGASDLFVVGLLGFPTAGKTWFLNRLKWLCSEHGGLTPIPGAARNRSTVGGTTAVSIHRFVRQGAGFALIDMPGERFRAGVESEFKADSKILTAIKASDALLVLLPADEALFAARASRRHGERGEVAPQEQAAQAAAREEVLRQIAAARTELAAARKAVAAAKKALKAKPGNRTAAAAVKAAEAERERLMARITELTVRKNVESGMDLGDTDQRLTQFIEGIGRMAGVISIRDNSPPGAEPEEYNDELVAQHIASSAFRPCDRPTFIALTKADLIHRPSAMLRSLLKTDTTEPVVLADYDRDPVHTVRTFRPSLAAAFDKWFRWSKFDFVTAFDGHETGLTINYEDHGHYGVEAVIEWIEWASGSTSWRDRHWRDIDWARAVRRFRDGGRGPRRRLGITKGQIRG